MSGGRLDALELKLPPVAVVLLLMVAMRLAVPFSPDITGRPELMRSLGHIVLFSGLLVAVFGAGSFWRHGTTADPMRPQRASALVDSGVFRWTRNPMYLGFVLVLLGVALRFDAWLALAGPVLLAGWLQRFQIRPEERILRDRFGAAFDDYCRRVPRWLGVSRN
jgi:protein-S-isoprenylcysteine O-methyltransferase Ste14